MAGKSTSGRSLCTRDMRVDFSLKSALTFQICGEASKNKNERAKKLKWGKFFRRLV